MRSGNGTGHNPAGGRGTVMSATCETPPGGLLQSVDLHPAIKALKMSDISKASLPKAIFLMGPTPPVKRR